MKKMAKLTLEDYSSLYHCSNPRSSLTIPQLNEIVFMHGFIKLHHSTKMAVLEVLQSIDLIPPARSTVQIGGSSCRGAGLLPEELQRDMEAIGWRECHVHSIIAVEEPVGLSTANDGHPMKLLGGAGEKRSGPKKEKKGKTGKMKKLALCLPMDSVSNS